MSSPLSYARVFEKDYAVCFVNVCTTEVLKDVSSSNFLATISRATYISYISHAKMIIRLKRVLLLLVNLATYTSSRKILEITYFDDPGHHVPSEEGRLFMLQVADPFVKNDHESVSFRAKNITGTQRHFSINFTFVPWSKIKGRF